MSKCDLGVWSFSDLLPMSASKQVIVQYLGVLIFQWPGCFDLSVTWVFWSFSELLSMSASKQVIVQYLGVLIFQWPGCFDLSVDCDQCQHSSKLLSNTWVFWSFSDLINVSIQASECPMEPNMQSGSLTKSDRCRCAQYHKVQRLVCAGATRGAFISWSWCVLPWLKVALGPARPPAQVVWSSGNVSQARQSHQKVFKPGGSHST